LSNAQCLILTIGSLFLLLVGGCASQEAASSRGTTQYVDALDALAAQDKPRAVDLLQRAVDQNPDLIMAHAVLGDLYFDQNQTARAADQYQALTHLDPYNADNFYKLGLSEQLLNRLKAAAASYLRALELNPQDARAARNVGLVYLALNQPAEAARFLKQSIDLDGKNADGYANYGVALDALGRYPEAENAYRQALELGGEPAVILLNLGSDLMTQKRPEDAADVLRQAVEKSDIPLARLRLGEALAMGHQDAAALEQFRHALRLNPNYYPAMNAAGKTILHQYTSGLQLDDGKRDAALAMWRESLRLHPDQPEIRRQIQQWSRPGVLGVESGVR
jgi:tetratricopeptide (TPR) repeat protein